MRNALTIVMLVGLLLPCCTSKTVDVVQPKVVQVSLYDYPEEWPYDLPLKKPSVKALQHLIRGEKRHSASLDLSRGIPISSLDRKENGDLAFLISWFKQRSISYMPGDDFLDYLVPAGYRKFGWIDWFLVRRDQNKNILEVIAEGKGRHEKSLIEKARNGDELIGGSGF